jgi:hypothetical protein
LKEFGKEFNIYQLKPKLSITQKETITLLVKVNTLRVVMLKEVINQDSNLDINNKELLMFHQVKEFTIPLMFKVQDKAESEVDQLFKELPLNMLLDQLIPQDKPIQQDKHTPLDKLMSLEAVESEEKMFTDNLKLVVMSPVEVGSDNDFEYFYPLIHIFFIKVKSLQKLLPKSNFMTKNTMLWILKRLFNKI